MQNLELSLDTGRVRGFVRIGLDSRDPQAPSAAFLGIPFAEPPVGDLRFLAPVPRRPWAGVREATTYGPTAQKRAFGQVTAIPEPSIPGDDILTVNVFTPRPGDTDARLPVLFWIHGGGYKAGSPASPWYDGHAFNTDGVVVVTVGYRLGFDGCASIPGVPENRGLLDQIEALRWVQRNIAAFGGDPQRVTIAGQSAGGGSVLALLVSPLARGLFAAAISESGALGPKGPEESAAATSAIASTLGVPATLEGFRSASDDAILDASEELERTRSGDLVGENPVTAILDDTGGLPFFPVADPVSLPGDWVTTVRASTIPLLMGATAHEFAGGGGMYPPSLTASVVDGLLRSSVLGDLADDFITGYPGFTGGDLLGQLITDVTFRQWIPAIGSGRAEPLWAYDFRWVNQNTGMAAHCADLPFFWHILNDPKVAVSSGPDAPSALADIMHGSWVEFISTHAVGWSPWSPQSPRAMVFDAAPHEADDYVYESYLADRLGSD